MSTEEIVIDHLAVLLTIPADLLKGVVVTEQFLGGVTERLQQYGRRELATTVDTDPKNIFMIKIKIKPGAAIRDNPCVEKHLTTGMTFTFVMREKDPWRTMQLADDNPLGPIDDKGAIFGHQRDFTEINFLLLDVTNRLGTGLFIHIPGHQAHLNLDGCRVSHAALMAFLNIILRRTQAIRNILHGTGITEVPNRENRTENSLQTGRLTS